MKIDWQRKFYKNYITNHLSFVRDKQIIGDFKKQFAVWGVYYGDFLPESREAEIMEIGCGSGGLIYWLNSLGYKNVLGIDFSQEQVEEAKKMGIMNVILGDFEKFLDKKEDIYDCIIARDVIEHFNKEEILDIFNSIHNSLKPNGCLIIQTPNAESPFGSRYRYYDFTHQTGFTSASLNQTLKAVGFQKTEFYPMRPAIHGFKSLIRWFLWQGIELIIYLYLLVETGSGKGIFTQNMIALAEK